MDDKSAYREVMEAMDAFYEAEAPTEEQRDAALRAVCLLTSVIYKKLFKVGDDA